MRRSVLMLALGIGLAAGPMDAQQWSLAGDAHVRAAADIARRLRAGAFDSVAAAVDPHVPAGVFSTEALARIWADATARFGRLTTFVPVRCTPVRWTHMVTFEAQFEHERRALRVVVDDAGGLSGLFFGAPEPAAPPPGPAPAYARLDTFAERELTLGAEPWKLSATLSVPKGAGPFPAVVLVHGSGPHDRDETIGPNRPFRDLAYGLASRGIVVLRYDKRTWVHGARMADTGLEEEVVADALAALDTLRQTPGVDPRAVYLLGHSLGGFMAPTIAARDPRLSGAILLGANTGALSELTAEQLRYLASLQSAPEPGLEATIGLIDSLRAGKLADSTRVLGAPVRYWHEVDAVHPVEVARRVATPLLILQGGRDYQVPPRELEVWRRELAGRPHTTLRQLPALNHLFIAGTGPSTPQEYAAEGHVDEEVIETVARWIRRH